jgi:cob(I)alamin adenosyltransferase
MASGKVMIFMGDGYGKSAAALGIAMKRASEGDSIVIIQFLKGKGITDSPFTKRLEPEIKLFRFDKYDRPYEDLTAEEQEEERAHIRNGLGFAKKVLDTSECNVIILDEALELLECGIVETAELVALFEALPEGGEMILTGTHPCKELWPYVDEVTEVITDYKAAQE